MTSKLTVLGQKPHNYNDVFGLPAVRPPHLPNDANLHTLFNHTLGEAPAFAECPPVISSAGLV